MKTILQRLCLVACAPALYGAAATAANATPLFSLEFEGSGTGSGNVAEDFAPFDLTIAYGIYTSSLDEFGDPIPGSEHWEADPSGGSVPVINPSSVLWGVAPAGNKALDVRGGAVVLVFATPIQLTAFSALLDNSTFGDFFGTDILFYSADHTLLHSEAVDQTQAGASINADLSGVTTEVKTIVLPATAFYDNITVEAVPEPGTAVAFLAGGVLLMLRRRRMGT